MSDQENQVADAATDAAAPKKERKARAPKLDENGNPIAKAPREPKVAKPREYAIPREGALTVLVEKNPKREGSAAAGRFEGYFTPGLATVQDALNAGLTPADLFHDIGHGFIKVEGFPKAA